MFVCLNWRITITLPDSILIKGEPMNSIRPFIAIFFSMAVIIHLSAPFSFSDEAEMKALQETINALEKKVNQLEYNSNQRYGIFI